MILALLLFSSICFADPPPTAPNWDEIASMIDKSVAEDDEDTPAPPGASRDSNGRAYTIRIERRVVHGQVQWRCWQQYLDMPEPVWADYEPIKPRRVASRRSKNRR